MNAARVGALAGAVLFLLQGPVAHAEPPFEIPVVPCALLDGGCGPGTEAAPRATAAWGGEAGGPMIRTVLNGRDNRALAHRSGFQRTAAMELGPKVVNVTPGTTVLIEIAIGHLNRIVTPFAAPVVHTVSSASTQVDGSVLYVASDTEEPIALFIADGPGSETAIALTLAPRYLPPREIRLQMPGRRAGVAAARTAPAGMPMAGAASPMLANPSMPEAGGGAPPYVAGLVELLRAAAQGKVPPGFTVQNRVRPAEVQCRGELKVTKAQLAVGAAATLLTAAVRNTGASTITLDRESCTAKGHVVAASAAWPRQALGPGENTEMFLVLAHGTLMRDPTGTPQ